MKPILLTNEAVLALKRSLGLTAIAQTTGGRVTFWKRYSSEYSTPEGFATKVLEEMKDYRPALLKVQAAQMNQAMHNMVVIQLSEVQEPAQVGEPWSPLGTGEQDRRVNPLNERRQMRRRKTDGTGR